MLASVESVMDNNDMVRWLKRGVFIAGLLFLAGAIGCAERPSTATATSNNPSAPQRAATPAKTNDARQVFQVKGVLQELKVDGKTVVIRHEEIPGYMKAMTMPFAVKDSKELTGLKPGDQVSFRMVVTDTDGWIEQVTRTGSAQPPSQYAWPSFRQVRSVDPVKVGDLMPDYPFTNQLGQVIRLGDFKGQALAFTFIFTRCPFPTFCPRMSNCFEEAQKQIKAMANGPTNWHLLTISFDPEFDTPPTLKTYAQRYHYDPQHWSFVTGALMDIDAIGEQFGLMFYRQDNSINHNLRTVVVDAQGRVQKVFTGNEWKADELVEELVKAASAKAAL